MRREAAGLRQRGDGIRRTKIEELEEEEEEGKHEGKAFLFM
jgi:hypothetical protein